jgi:hypothetical protein
MTALIALMLGLCAQAQDDKKDDGRLVASEALQKTAKKGSFSVAGELKTEIDPDDADEEPYLCKVAGAVAPGSRASFKITGDASVHELVLKDGKMAGRETWKGHSLDLVNGPSELLSLLDFDRLAVHVKNAGSAKALPDEKVGDEECAAIELQLPKESIRSFHDDPDAATDEERSLRGARLKLCVRKSDGLVASLEANVRRLYKNEQHPRQSTRGLSSFSLAFKDFGTAEIVPPPGLDK